jgi:hypothetical protein
MKEIINHHLKMNTDKELSSIRGHFAGSAIQGLLASGAGIGAPSKYAIMAYEYADAMMKERAK